MKAYRTRSQYEGNEKKRRLLTLFHHPTHTHIHRTKVGGKLTKIHDPKVFLSFQEII